MKHIKKPRALKEDTKKNNKTQPTNKKTKAIKQIKHKTKQNIQQNDHPQHDHEA